MWCIKLLLLLVIPCINCVNAYQPLHRLSQYNTYNNQLALQLYNSSIYHQYNNNNGNTTQITECDVFWPDLQPCSNGVCISNQCVCDPGWTGLSDFINLDTQYCHNNIIVIHVLYYIWLVVSLIVFSISIYKLLQCVNGTYKYIYREQTKPKPGRVWAKIKQRIGKDQSTGQITKIDLPSELLQSTHASRNHSGIHSIKLNNKTTSNGNSMLASAIGKLSRQFTVTPSQSELMRQSSEPDDELKQPSNDNNNTIILNDDTTNNDTQVTSRRNTRCGTNRQTLNIGFKQMMLRAAAMEISAAAAKTVMTPTDTTPNNNKQPQLNINIDSPIQPDATLHTAESSASHSNQHAGFVIQVETAEEKQRRIGLHSISALNNFNSISYNSTESINDTVPELPSTPVQPINNRYDCNVSDSKRSARNTGGSGNTFLGLDSIRNSNNKLSLNSPVSTTARRSHNRNATWSASTSGGKALFDNTKHAVNTNNTDATTIHPVTPILSSVIVSSNTNIELPGSTNTTNDGNIKSGGTSTSARIHRRQVTTGIGLQPAARLPAHSFDEMDLHHHTSMPMDTTQQKTIKLSQSFADRTNQLLLSDRAGKYTAMTDCIRTRSHPTTITYKQFYSICKLSMKILPGLINFQYSLGSTLHSLCNMCMICIRLYTNELIGGSMRMNILFIISMWCLFVITHVFAYNLLKLAFKLSHLSGESQTDAQLFLQRSRSILFSSSILACLNSPLVFGMYSNTTYEYEFTTAFYSVLCVTITLLGTCTILFGKRLNTLHNTNTTDSLNETQRNERVEVLSRLDFVAKNQQRTMIVCAPLILILACWRYIQIRSSYIIPCLFIGASYQIVIHLWALRFSESRLGSNKTVQQSNKPQLISSPQLQPRSRATINKMNLTTLVTALVAAKRQSINTDHQTHDIVSVTMLDSEAAPAVVTQINTIHEEVVA